MIEIDDHARELLDALAAAEADNAALQARVAELEEWREAALEGLGLDLEQEYDAGRVRAEGYGWQMSCSSREQRVAELEAREERIWNTIIGAFVGGDAIAAEVRRQID